MNEKASEHSQEVERVTFVPVVPGKSGEIRLDGKVIGTLTRDIINGNMLVPVTGWPGLAIPVDLLKEIGKISDKLDDTAKPEEPETEK